ncbi:MAG: hypothetical protein HFI68_07685 [Lachnospiraceae bacterium]|nr:hypothetical protein [Lachnospiraceae bacterium]
MKRRKAVLMGITVLFLSFMGNRAVIKAEAADATAGEPSVSMEAPGEEADPIYFEETVSLYQAGAFETDTSGIMAYDMRTGSQEEQIYQSLSQVSPQLDVSGWGLTEDEMAAMFERVVNGHPDLFYVSNIYHYTLDASSGKVLLMKWEYRETDQNRINAMKASMEAEVSNILNKMDSSMTDLEKLMVIHEALVINITYSETTAWDNGKGCYTAYCALVEGKAVCHGYALAFNLLAERAGIGTARFVGSSNLKHAWNLVAVDGQTYHVDCTWDDQDITGKVYHRNFLLSDAGIRASGHTSWNDASLTGTGNIYDNYYWRDYAYDFEFTKRDSVWYLIDQPGAPTEKWKRIGLNLLNPDAAVTVPVSVRYQTHAQTYGWQSPVSDGMMAGTTNQSKRLEAIKIEIAGNRNLGITYQTHVQSYGWQNWVSDGGVSGTANQAKRLEAVKIRLTGTEAADYDVYYRVYVQSYGWLGWAKNGESAGTEGLAKRMEAIEIQVKRRGEAAPVSTKAPFIQPPLAVTYETHVQSYGWQKPVSNGAMAGTSGQSKRMEAIRINLENLPVSGGICYQAHVQSYGWQKPVADGALAGTVGRGKRLEAICITLTGELAKQYDVYYRVHGQSYGWQGWVKNGAVAGSIGRGKRLEAIEIRLEKKK